ncbi:GNAT family N-acetyltransferase (plasmid) [Nocardia sp. CWNU-33]|uniref:GNAT family N-acetyltransferase n=1 Tax=Nocardia sp. CWNU-33 TaxID=3392117 RepID=UPI00398F65F1
MVRLRYLTDCDEAVRSKVLGWAHTDEYVARIGMPDRYLQCPPGAENSLGGRIFNWVIFAGEQPVGVVSATVQDRPYNRSDTEMDDPADYPSLGMVTYIDPAHRCRGYASASKQAISEHPAASGVRTFGCVIAADNTASLKSIEKAGYECVRVMPVEGKPDRLHFRRWTCAR